MGKRKAAVKRSLRPALYFEDQFYVGPEGAGHSDIYPHVPVEGIKGEPWSEHYVMTNAEHGFVSDEMKFYDRATAWDYAKEHGLLSKAAIAFARQEGWTDFGWLNSYDLSAQDELLARLARERAMAARAKLLAEREAANDRSTGPAPF